VSDFEFCSLSWVGGREMTENDPGQSDAIEGGVEYNEDGVLGEEAAVGESMLFYL